MSSGKIGMVFVNKRSARGQASIQRQVQQRQVQQTQAPVLRQVQQTQQRAPMQMSRITMNSIIRTPPGSCSSCGN